MAATAGEAENSQMADEASDGFHSGGGCRVYVGNLAWRTKWQDLKDHMRQAGNVRHADILQDAEGRSKGCAIVQYETTDEARQATQALTNTVLDGRKIFVREDRENTSRFAPRAGPRPAGPPAPAGPRRTRQTSPAMLSGFPPLTEETDGKQVVVFNLPWAVNSEGLREMFGRFGELVEATVCMQEDGRSRGKGFVIYASAKDAELAVVGMDTVAVQDRALQVKIDPRSGKAEEPEPTATTAFN